MNRNKALAVAMTLGVYAAAGKHGAVRSHRGLARKMAGIARKMKPKIKA
jgi:hypothetical protein